MDLYFPVDPLTQGLLGAAAAQAAFGRKLPRSAWAIGLVAGLAPDLDVFVRPASDPLGGTTYHRHFTHALIFIPPGAAVAALPFLPWRAFAGMRIWVFAAALVAYATHGLLDACTSYGTLLYWPFSELRVAWDFIGIIDPIFTGALLIGVITSAVRGSPVAARAAVVICIAYMSLGAWQHARVMDVQRELAQRRGHTIQRSRVMPTPINLMLWRSVYLADGRLWADAVWMPVPLLAPAGEAKVQPGASVDHLTLDDLRDAGYHDPAVLHAFDRFAWFADDYVAWDEGDHGGARRIVGDMRYVVGPDRFASLWGLRLPDPAGDDAEARARKVSLPNNRDLAGLWSAVLGKHPAFVRLRELPGEE